MFYRIENGQAPKYLVDIVPPKVKDIVPYHVRNADNFIIPRYRVETFKRSFIVYGAGLWNELDLVTHGSISLTCFNSALVKMFEQFPNRHKDSYKLFCHGDILIIT